MAAPTKESPFPTVILQHELPDGTTHIDWLLGADADGKKQLISFRAPERPDKISENRWVDLESRPDHRPEYLHIEGQLEGDRGVVTRLAIGDIFMWKEIPHGWNLMVKWDHGVTEFEIVTGQGVLAVRRILESQSQEPPPPLPRPSTAVELSVEEEEGPAGLSRKITAFGKSKKEVNGSVFQTRLVLVRHTYAHSTVN